MVYITIGSPSNTSSDTSFVTEGTLAVCSERQTGKLDIFFHRFSYSIHFMTSIFLRHSCCFGGSCTCCRTPGGLWCPKLQLLTDGLHARPLPFIFVAFDMKKD